MSPDSIAGLNCESGMDGVGNCMSVSSMNGSVSSSTICNWLPHQDARWNGVLVSCSSEWSAGSPSTQGSVSGILERLGSNIEGLPHHEQNAIVHSLVLRHPPKELGYGLVH